MASSKIKGKRSVVAKDFDPHNNNNIRYRQQRAKVPPGPVPLIPHKDLPQPQAEEPVADMVGAVAGGKGALGPYPESEYFDAEAVAPFTTRENGDVVCANCQSPQQFRGIYEKAQAITAQFVGWKCTNPQCPTHKPG